MRGVTAVTMVGRNPWAYTQSLRNQAASASVDASNITCLQDGTESCTPTVPETNTDQILQQKCWLASQSACTCTYALSALTGPGQHRQCMRHACTECMVRHARGTTWAVHGHLHVHVTTWSPWWQFCAAWIANATGGQNQCCSRCSSYGRTCKSKGSITMLPIKP